MPPTPPAPPTTALVRKKAPNECAVALVVNRAAQTVGAVRARPPRPACAAAISAIGPCSAGRADIVGTGESHIDNRKLHTGIDEENLADVAATDRHVETRGIQDGVFNNLQRSDGFDGVVKLKKDIGDAADQGVLETGNGRITDGDGILRLRAPAEQRRHRRDQEAEQCGGEPPPE